MKDKVVGTLLDIAKQTKFYATQISSGDKGPNHIN
jgi:hypothetical protein